MRRSSAASSVLAAALLRVAREVYLVRKSTNDPKVVELPSPARLLLAVAESFRIGLPACGVEPVTVAQH